MVDVKGGACRATQAASFAVSPQYLIPGFLPASGVIEIDLFFFAVFDSKKGTPVPSHFVVKLALFSFERTLFFVDPLEYDSYPAVDEF